MAIQNVSKMRVISRLGTKQKNNPLTYKPADRMAHSVQLWLEVLGLNPGRIGCFHRGRK